jgi:hypothetical protein
MAEALAMKNGLSLVNQLGYSRMQAESDCLEAIDPYSVSDRWWSEASTVFEECIDSG